MKRQSTTWCYSTAEYSERVLSHYQGEILHSSENHMVFQY